MGCLFYHLGQISSGRQKASRKRWRFLESVIMTILKDILSYTHLVIGIHHVLECVVIP